MSWRTWVNAIDSTITSNLAIVPVANGFISAFASDPTHLVVDVLGYFALSEIGELRDAIRVWEQCRELQTINSDGSIEKRWEMLQRMVSRNIRRMQYTPMLLWERTPRRQPRLRFRSVPKTLLAALWVQFAMAVEGDRQYHQCDQCGLWFEVAGERRVGANEKREGAKFCSNACRFRAYRHRQNEARELHAEGKSLKEVAGQLGSDVKTVTGWIRRKEK